jgi:streptogramin lyase
MAGGQRGVKGVQNRAATIILVVIAGLVTSGEAPAAADVGDITEFSEGLFHDNGPEAIVPGPDGDLWFTNPGNEDSIGKITTDGVVTEFKIDIPNAFMESIARGPDGNLWYTDPTKSINRFTPDGELTRFMDRPRVELRPKSIVRGADGNLWFTVEGGEPRAIGRITPTGEITEYLMGLNPGSFPYGIAAGLDGNVWFTDVGTTPAIGRITPSGEITEFSAGLSPGSTIERIAPGPDGNMWFTNRGSTKAIGRITPLGEIAEFTEGLGSDSNPKGITPGPDGNLWFTDRGTVDSTRAIGRITPAGEITEWRTGLNANNFLEQITAGEDGNVWFTDSGFTPALGRALTGEPPAVELRPTLEGSSEVGGTLLCDGEEWATWAIGAPVPNSSTDAPAGVQWSRSGVPIPGATNRTYQLTPTDRGNSISCTVAATYPLVDVIATAHSDSVALPSPPPDPEPPNEPERPTLADRSDSQTLQAPSAMTIESAPIAPAASPILRCKPTRGTTRCTIALTSTDSVVWLRLSRRSVTYAQGRPTRRGEQVLLRFHPPQPLRRGRYALTIVRQDHSRRQATMLRVRLGSSGR